MIPEGRFAPTPSGKLHFGSLSTAVGSYIHARSRNGFWHLRIEDIDTIRCKQEYSDDILFTLEKFGFTWDGPVIYQSQRSSIYQDALSTLKAHNYIYGSICTRAEIKASDGNHPQFCRKRNLPISAKTGIRFKLDDTPLSFFDERCGTIKQQANVFSLGSKDFLLKRHDGIWCYNLASVIDDIETNINEVVRGEDLLENTFDQIALIQAEHGTVPNYCHLPLVMEGNGKKLSKQNHAPTVDTNKINELLAAALKFLGQKIPEEYMEMSGEEILYYAAKNFSLKNLPLYQKKKIFS